MTTSASENKFSVTEARDIVRDLFVHNPWIYWSDFLISLTIGYAAGFVYLTFPMSWQKLVCFVIAGLALYRVAMFMHEVVHMSGKTLRSFRWTWNLLAGVPLLTPVPSIAKLYGFLSRSLLAIETVAVRLPRPDGSKVMTNDEVFPDETVAEGCCVTVKSEAWVPEILTRGEPDNVRSAEPVLRITNVWIWVTPTVATSPK